MKICERGEGPKALINIYNRVVQKLMQLLNIYLFMNPGLDIAKREDQDSVLLQVEWPDTPSISGGE